ncbi:MAG: hypothetical protein EPO32_00395 [Anaerolineae bacterium]|nr:MAG: hypothetical protein EPO32_00395 [Anaerolineae bacterium]
MYNHRMPHATRSPMLIARRGRRAAAADHRPDGRWGRAGIGLAAVFSVIGAVAAILLSRAYVQITADLPTLDSLPVLLGPQGQLRTPSRILDRSGEHILLEYSNPATLQAQYLTLEEIPQFATDALVAELDPGFWQHDGAALTDLFDPMPRTLAERLVLDLLLYAEPPSQQRALRMRILATQATSEFGREFILEWFVNSADFGYLAHGLDAASRVYFAKPAAGLSLAEAAMLAAISGAPELNPFDAPALALERQGRVLQAMVNQGLLTPEVALSANQSPLTLSSENNLGDTETSDFISLVLHQVTPFFSLPRIQRGGLVIITSLDLATQRAVECASEIQVNRLQGVIPLDSLAGITCDAARLLPQLSAAQVVPGARLSAQVIVLENATGQVRALAGPSDALHPAGTSLSPFVYLTAFTRGFGPASLVWDVPASLPPELEGYSNADGQFHGPVRIRTALANDYVIPALQVLSQVGPANVWRTAQQAGLLTIDTAEGYQPLLDSGEVSLLELAHAYSIFGNQGFLVGQTLEGDHLSPGAVISITDPDGRTLLDWTQPEQRALTSAQLAFLITDILGDTLARQSSLGRPNPLEVDRPAAAKLGQTPNNENAWTIGYSPQLTVAVWLGQATESTASPINPLSAAGLWHAAFRSAHANLPPKSFDEPVGISRVAVCDPSGLLPTEYCPNVVEELFIPGNEPLFADNLFQPIQINRQTGRLATVFTPPELAETRVYLVVPPFAVDWARAAGIDLPPEDYDAVFASAGSEAASITSPAPFSYVSGQVPIIGHANVPSFAFYRVQVGEGLNPRQWLQIGADVGTPVSQGQLAIWETSGLNGLYAIQLLVIDGSNTVLTSTTQVTVDNLAPELRILYPAMGQAIETDSNSSLTFQAEATDNIGLARLEFLVDGRSLISLTSPPFAALWDIGPGQHTLTVRAFDEAGNMTEETIEFSISP